ncbi:murein hydrolase activator EnvC [Streptomyces sp. SAJ15]|uniref:murein hydrolase activator EnvC family protein n=1 Tax=Streptomyces sp. SAJ15 TaxID=2011095 RepID=UPI001185CEDE|nr:peptidase M23 [Streptomyces sp. SAJ15]
MSLLAHGAARAVGAALMGLSVLMVLVVMVLALAPRSAAYATPVGAAAGFGVTVSAEVAEVAGGGAEGGRSWPVGGRPPVLRGWEPPDSPYGPGHRGVDLAASPGEPVLAAAPGRVSFAGRVAGRGVVSIELDGTGAPPLRTTYEPVRARVRVGEAVKAGQVVGVLEPGPFHCAVGCLHWGLRRADRYLDPLSLLPPWLLRRGPSRLLPIFDVPRGAPLVPSGGSAAGAVWAGATTFDPDRPGGASMPRARTAAGGQPTGCADLAPPAMLAGAAAWARRRLHRPPTRRTARRPRRAPVEPASGRCRGYRGQAGPGPIRIRDRRCASPSGRPTSGAARSPSRGAAPGSAAPGSGIARRA